MNNKSKKISKSIQTVYVFSKNNEVYLNNNNITHTDHWLPITFQWKSTFKLKRKDTY